LSKKIDEKAKDVKSIELKSKTKTPEEKQKHAEKKAAKKIKKAEKKKAK